MSLRNIPPEKMNFNEIVDFIKMKIPEIGQEIQRRYVRFISQYRLESHDGGIRWRDWSDAVNAAMNMEIEPAWSEASKLEILKEVYHEYIRPYAGQFKKKGDAMAEAYMVCKRLCVEWSIPDDNIHYGLKFVDLWEKEQAWDAVQLPQN